jgi:hypothetical protein
VNNSEAYAYPQHQQMPIYEVRKSCISHLF